jgi:hypothetical protein
MVQRLPRATDNSSVGEVIPIFMNLKILSCLPYLSLPFLKLVSFITKKFGPPKVC